jgi:hypothetical protein
MWGEILLNSVLKGEAGFAGLCKIEQDIDGLDNLFRFRLQKLSYAAEKAFAERSLLLDDNRLLFTQNNEKVSRAPHVGNSMRDDLRFGMNQVYFKVVDSTC